MICGNNVHEFYDDQKAIQMSRIVPSEPEEIVKQIGRITPFNHPSVIYIKALSYVVSSMEPQGASKIGILFPQESSEGFKAVEAQKKKREKFIEDIDVD